MSIFHTNVLFRQSHHKHDYLKYKIFSALWEVYPKYASPNEIAEMINVDTKKVGEMLGHYQKYRYIGRRKGKCPIMNRTMYKYRIKVLGVETYLKLYGLYVQGVELNPWKMERGKACRKIDSYTGLTRAGYERMMKEGNDMDIISVDCADIC